MDFRTLADHLRSQSRIFLPGWLPGGKPRGREYVCASLRGGNGDSFSVNMDTGAWADFAVPGVTGGDLISLYAAINNIRQKEAFEKLSESYMPSLVVPKKETPKIEVSIVPADQKLPEMRHPELGIPSAYWKYKDKLGNVLFYVARYNDPICGKCGTKGVEKVCVKCGTKQSKITMPWSWVPKFKNFRATGFPPPRPLYGLELINQTPLLIVEGEKTCDAARKIVGDAYTVITWSHGTNSVAKTDWSPAFGLPILLWPDADEPGVKAVYQIAEILKNQCPNLKIIGVQGHPEGWDAANAFDEGWNYSKFLEWAKPRAQKYETMAEVVNKESIKIDTSETEVVTKSVYSMWESLGLAMDKNGNPICNMDNVLRIFETSEEFRNVVWYDEFHKKYFTTWHTGVPREWSDVDDLMLTQFFQRELGLSRIGDEHINKAIRVYGTKNKRNEPMDWLNTLKWDGIARIENFFVDCFGAKDNEYHRSASKNWWTSMVARVLSPGIKVDSMIVLEGKQGKFKSTALGVIGGPWYTEAHESVTSKDFFMLFQGKLIIEIAELDAFSRAETNTIKKVITCQVDRYRPPYGRATCDFPRQCIFVGTTNESNYLHDITGARRFWPIKTGIIDVNKIREQREKLFAEAVVLVMHGHKWYEMPASTEEVQEQRRDTDEWEHIIECYVETHNPGEFGFLISEIAKDCLNITTDKLDKRSQNRIGKILRLLGFENKVVRRGGASVASRSWLKLSRPVDLV